MTQQDAEPVFVLLLDWRGHIVWTSQQINPPTIGDLAWKRLVPESAEKAKEMHAKTASLRQPHSLVVVNEYGTHYRCWLWPLDTPDIAVCVLCREVPSALSELSEREMECLQFLSQGLPIREIAEQLSISINTLYTHLSRAREKLNLESLEALISFAARYCYPANRPLAPSSKT